MIGFSTVHGMSMGGRRAMTRLCQAPGRGAQIAILLGSTAAALLSTTQTAVAIPSFARQTGFACARCHTVAYGPALTAYGRQFKLNGYVWGDAKEVIPPIAIMVQGGFTHTAKDQSEPPANHFATNDNLSVDQVSLFYGGRISDHPRSVEFHSGLGFSIHRFRAGTRPRRGDDDRGRFIPAGARSNGLCHGR